MTYFVDPYKKYYEKLNVASGMSSKSGTISSNVSTLTSNANNISGKISASTWKEMGATEIINKIIPGLSTLLTKFGNDLTSTLSTAVSIATGTIVPKASELKEKDEKFDNLKSEIETLNSSEPTLYDKDNNETSEHTSWRRQLADKIEEKNKLEADCKQLQQDIDAAAKEINSLEVSSSDDTSITVGTGANDYGTIISNDGTFLKINYSGSTFNVINTQNISVTDFVQYINDYHLNQTDNQGYGDSCLGVAKAYGKKLYFNTKLQTNMDAFYSAAYTQWDNGTFSENKEEILRLVYNELVQGKPCVLQVTTKAGNRHFATVVGMKDTVTSADDLTEEDLLIIDSWDGKLEAMDDSVTADRHMHKEGGKYRVDRLNA